MFTRLRLRFVLAMTPRGWAIVPRTPTYTMERAYFSAPMPEFSQKASANLRRRRNKAKMVNRWNAMVVAGEAVVLRKGLVPRD